MRCKILTLLAFAALTNSAVFSDDVDRRETDLATARHDFVERYESIGRRLVIGGGASIGGAAETVGAALNGGGAVNGSAAIGGGAAETTGGGARPTGTAQPTGAAAETSGGAAETGAAAQTTAAQPTAAATSAAPTSGGSCSDIPYDSHLSHLFKIKIFPSPTTQPATSGSLNLISSLLNLLGSLLSSGSSSKDEPTSPIPSPAYLSSQGTATSQENAGTFSIVEGEGLDYLVSVDPKTCRPSTNCTGYYSGNISDATTDIPPFHDLTLTSSFEEAQASSLNGEWKIQPANPPTSSSWRLNFWPFSNRGKPPAQPQLDPSLVLINPAFSTVGNEMIFGALVTTGGQFSTSAQVFGTGSSTYQSSSAFQAVNLCVQYVQQ